MTSIIVVTIAAAAVTQNSSASVSTSESVRQNDYQVKVHLNCTADVPATLLWPSQEVARDLFARIGVRLVWGPGHWHPSQSTGVAGTGEPIQREFAIEISPRVPKAFDQDALAFAMPYGDTSVGVVIFYNRVKFLLREHRTTPEAVIFGHILAHEIGHVLERINRHSETGVMRAHWTEDDFTQMAAGRLGFTAEDATFIRNSLTIRNMSPASNRKGRGSEIEPSTQK